MQSCKIFQHALFVTKPSKYLFSLPHAIPGFTVLERKACIHLEKKTPDILCTMRVIESKLRAEWKTALALRSPGQQEKQKEKNVNAD